MKNQASTTLRQIAARAGCSHVTVSFALRNDPRLPAATRRRIQKLAKKMGYRPNPLVATLMTQLRGIRQKPYVATLAWIQHHEPRDEELRQAGEYMFPFVAARAAQLGYQMESFWIHPCRADLSSVALAKDEASGEGGSPGMTPARLSQILHARNIRGAILAPWTKYQIFWPLRWERLSVVAIGHTPFQPDIHRVVPDIFSNITLILKQLRELGYQRIGFAIPEWGQNMGLEQVSGPFQLHYNKSLPSNRIPQLVIPGFNPKGEQQFIRYLRKYRPEALICAGVIFKTWIEKLGLSIPKDIGLVETDVMSDPGTRDWSGIDLHADRLGASAVDLLVSELQNNRLGLPEFSKMIAIKGKWVAGTTVRNTAGSSPEWRPAAVIGILMDPSLAWESSYFARKLVHEIEKEVGRMGMESDLDRKRGRSDSRNGTGPDRPPWIIRVYDQFGPLFRSDPSWDQNRQRLADDLRYHDFRGWIVIGTRLDQLPDRREIEHLPHVQMISTDSTTIRIDRHDFIYQSVKHLVRHGHRRICYLGDKTYPDEGKVFHAAARELGAAEAQLILAVYQPPMDKYPYSAEKFFSRDVALYNFTLKLAKQWKQSGKGPDGLIVRDDVAMRAVAMALAKAGLAVPRQLMVVSMANEGIPFHYAVPVVRYEFSVAKIACELVRILRQRMAGEPTGPLPVVIRGKIVPGEIS